LNVAKWKEIPSPEAIVRAALEKAREEGFWAGRSCGGSKAEIDAALASLRSLASDPAEVAAIIKKAGEDRG
jgi:hypothetical protein